MDYVQEIAKIKSCVKDTSYVAVGEDGIGMLTIACIGREAACQEMARIVDLALKPAGYQVYMLWIDDPAPGKLTVGLRPRPITNS